MDVSVPLERQKETLQLIWRYLGRDYLFSDKDEARTYFTRLMGLIKDLNYSPQESQEYLDYLKRIDELQSARGNDQLRASEEAD